MRYNERQQYAHTLQNQFGVDFHKFMEAEGNANQMELAQEFGISLGEVKKLKDKLDRA
ncbi:hypothetical protein NC797_04890 [Aquibacillus sp. 3ASR75-11]|uniref:RNA polymerase subunit sigma-70 n=1 Tax=Terrihalobacillus insolitus TaxID=2950438 RepID=A0A9X3WQA9_9BACI|nr:hypothetical protein [Terrihalobacillus insolitus]MDC3412425.1 hypothetical protein [Terrihalobacillus insolitus]MDC3423845.1 hypothetical protein [Terrihalobacillus insolitus]